jgi:CspA family cold shock protein
VIATVVEWRTDEGWGVLQTDEVPENIWLHFSNIEMDGYRFLNSGDRVEVKIKGPLPYDVEGYRYVATVARPIP